MRCGQLGKDRARRVRRRRRNVVKLRVSSGHTRCCCSFAFPVFTIWAEDKDSPFGRVDVDIFVSWEYDLE